MKNYSKEQTLCYDISVRLIRKLHGTSGGERERGGRERKTWNLLYFMFEQYSAHELGELILFYFSQIYNLLYKLSNKQICYKETLVRSDHPMMILLYIYSLYSSSSLWSFKSEGHCRFSLRLTFNGLLHSVT
jgi:hypothetical protein